MHAGYRSSSDDLRGTQPPTTPIRVQPAVGTSASHPGVLGRPHRRDRRRDRARVVMVGRRAGARLVLRAHVRRHRRLSPLLLAPGATRPSRAFQFLLALAGADAAAEGRALVGEPPPLAPQVFRRPEGCPLGAPARLLVVAHRLDHAPRIGRDRRRRVRDLASIPSCAGSTARGMRRRPSLLALAFFLCSAAGMRSSGATSSRRCCSGTARSRSTRWRTCSASGATRPTDDSRNNWLLALLTTGEGWHNNHHHYQSSANQGFRWWEIDVTYYVLRLLARLGPRSGTCAVPRPTSSTVGSGTQPERRASCERRALTRSGVKVRSRPPSSLPSPLIFTLTALIPTVLITAIGIIFLAAGGSKSVAVVGGHPGAGVLRHRARRLHAGTIFVTRGASLAAVQNEFLSSVSHELRTPLTSIRHVHRYAARRSRRPIPPRRQRCLAIDQPGARTAGRPGRQADRAVEDRITPRRVRAAAGRGGRHRRRRAGASSRRWIRHRRRRSSQVEHGLIVRGDRGRAGPGGGEPARQRLEVHATRRQAHRRVTAVATRSTSTSRCDNGLGIPPAEQEAIFEKFQRGAAARERGGARHPAWGSRSCARSWRRTAAGWTSAPRSTTAHASASRCPGRSGKRRERARPRELGRDRRGRPAPSPKGWRSISSSRVIDGGGRRRRGRGARR